MSIQSFFKSLISTSTRRRPSRWHLPVSRLCLESLEDRRLLTFNLAVNYAAGTNPQAIVSADFNSDGTLDLATANSGSSNVSVLLGNPGAPGFQAAQNSATGTQPLSLAVGDFNADGKLDLATANAGNVSVLLGNGNGTFGAPTNIDIGSSPASVAVGDFNGDGKLDLGVTSNLYYSGGCGYYGCYPGNYVGRANVLLGTGTGSFAAPNTTVLGTGYHMGAAVANFNGDTSVNGHAIQDFATVNRDNGTVSVLLGSATGLGAPTNFTTGWYPQAVTVGDFTGDGILDLATAGQTIDVLPGYGNGTFNPVVRAFIDPVALAAADFNGDGKLDLVTADYGNSVSVLLGTGTGTFRPPLDAATGAGAAGVAVGDFNGDGRLDVASANSSSNNVSVLLNDGIWPALDAPSITIGDVTVTEGNNGATAATFTVSLSAAYGQTVSIRYATADSSATAGPPQADYQATSGTLTFNPGGPLTQTITVQVIGDRLAEYDESFSVRLTNPTNAFVADATGVGTIRDDEPIVSIVDYSAVEGNTGTTAFTFTVTLSAVYDAPVTVAYATANLTPDEESWYGPGATAGVDYTATFGTLTILAGQTSGTITVLVTGDRLAEWDESFFVNLSNPTSAHLGSSLAVATIVDDEPRVSIADATAVLEGNAGTKSMTFTVTLSAASDAPVTVTYATADGSATAGGDYQAKTGTLTFNPGGPLTQTITVLVNGDRLGEYDESFYVNLTGTTTNAHIGNSLGSGTIQDDEPRISISDVTKAEGKRGQTTLFTFTVTLSAAYDQAVTMSFRTVNGTATSGSGDYVARTGTLTFAPGETSKTITIEVKGDSKREANETFYLDLFGNSSNSFFTKNRGIGSILNDD